MSLERRYIKDVIKFAVNYENDPKSLLNHIKMLAELYEDDDRAKKEIAKILDNIEKKNV